jgi:hypothetical protein
MGGLRREDLCVAAYGFLICERQTIPPQDRVPSLAAKQPPFPEDVEPTAPLRAETSHPQLYRHPCAIERRHRSTSPAMPFAAHRPPDARITKLGIQ